MTDEPPLLQVDGISLTLGGQRVLRELSLRVAPGAIVCVLGSNGVGKTTLMRVISGIYRNATGRIRLGGQDILNLPSHAIVARGIAQAPEGRHVFANMAVGENLRVAARGEASEFDRVLALFPVLRARLGQKAGSLSGGEQQMLCIGRALMARPRLLLLDEPSLGLAPKVVQQIFALIARIRAEGVSVLLVEQNVRAALQVADHAYVMEGGRSVLEGPAGEVAREPMVMGAYLGKQR